ncbi:MAG: peptidase U32 family protein [Candidatus Ancaeobacter aquaticus]|nr:peptidase U32 family protein [Candidatus Ancaeobacter aquaticus]
MKNIELVSPAGDIEKLRFAYHYGADAVYLSDNHYGMRKRAPNFSDSELHQAVSYAHSINKKVYAAVNIFLRNNEMSDIKKYLHFLHEVSVDAIIVSDPGILHLIKEEKLEFNIHLSTLANVTNWASAQFWTDCGIKRIILARELSLQEIEEIRKKVACELEVFVHGAMCVSYSGRCLISNYLSDRNANKGDCSQPCRWKYSVMEEKRPGLILPVEEDENGTRIFSAKDLSMVRYIKELCDIGVDAFKIEGRMKSIYYLGNVTRIYKKAMQSYKEGHFTKELINEFENELDKIPHRGYSTGFYFGTPDSSAQLYEKDHDDGNHLFMGVVTEVKNDSVFIKLKNTLRVDDSIEFLNPHIGSDHNEKILEMKNKEDFPITQANYNEIVSVKIQGKAYPNEIIRKKSRK